MKILLHACCADCILKFVESVKLEKNIEEVVTYFYNPNIHPRSEYLARLRAAQKISEENKIKLIVADWSPREWFELQNPSLQSPLVSQSSTSSLKKGGGLKNKNRCEKCWKLRLEKSLEYASKNSFEVVSTTLLTSHYQNKEMIKEIGNDLAKKYRIKFLVPQKIEKELKTSGFYKQNYCGCAYSLVEAWEEKFNAT